MDKQRILSMLAFFACICAFCVIALGAFTRLIDAGLGCPDWPGCYGHLMVPHAEIIHSSYPEAHFVGYKAWAEMIHRYAVAGLSMFILGIIVWVFSVKKVRLFKNILACIFLIALLSYQIMLGQLTVTLKLLPIVVTQHLLGGFLILSTLWLIYLMNCQYPIRRSQQRNRIISIMSILAVALVFLQIALGAWTSTNYASLSCVDFPFCNNNIPFIMDFKGAFNFFAPVGINYEGGVLSDSIRKTIQMTHRFGALVVTVYLFSFAVIVFIKLKDSLEILKSLYVMTVLLCVQLCIAMINIIFKLPLATAILHNIVAAMLLLAVITLSFKLKNYSEFDR